MPAHAIASSIVLAAPGGRGFHGGGGTVAEVNRRLVGSGISVYGLQEVRTSLEDWFFVRDEPAGG